MTVRTIVYPDEVENAWGFLSSQKSRILVRIEVLLIDQNLRGQDPDDPEYRDRFNKWLNTLWASKDIKISQMKRMAMHPAGGQSSPMTSGG